MNPSWKIGLAVVGMVVCWTIDGNAGSSFANLSQVITVFKMQTQDQAQRIDEQFFEAKKSSQQALSKEELAKLKAQAEEALHNASESIIGDGAMVYVGSVVVE